ncbi:lytic transglycosylase domain-containing protein [Herbaspirillum autotrophicum]|uniref:lytic transglycosylase domain-containing protein n=1 Tax=Herbaspirillum autotrophicum TaxID=180195 RepID=UPI00067D6B56|nr:lytic transglycosylase domain-containing protein [Herbaspirillum autotrophicum]
MQLKKCLAIAASIATAVCFALPVQAQKRLPAGATPDDIFLALRDAARSDDSATAASLAARLPDYAIASYVDYYRLKPRIRDFSATESEIRDFLTRYEGSAIADRLRNDWLLALGKRGDWTVFDEQYPQFVLNDDVQVKCFALNSRALKGQNVADEARALLVSPKDYGQGCSDLIATLAQNHQFDDNDVWTQIRQAAEAGANNVARRAALFTDNGDTSLQQATDKPALVLARGPGRGRTSHELYIIALGRAAKNNPQQAASFLSDGGSKLTAQEQALGWAQIALPASMKLAPEAIDYWRKTKDAQLSNEGYQWKVRMALRAGDWKLVKSTIEAMPPALRSDITWTYWLGRAQQEGGQNEAAQKQFQAIASNISFYGQLATEELGQKIMIPPGPTPATAAEIAPMAQNSGFKRAFKFYDLNMRFEGIREWNWELRKMNDRQLLAAAEFARQNDVLDRMVNTSDRTRTEMDFTQRFPAPHLTEMSANTRPLGLETAWVYGLIRQESRFIKNARSHVGASGLMQLMPATARFVAKKIGLVEFTPDQINDINTNLLLGTSYLNMVLGNLDGSQPLATAAYNAGPGRPRSWRSTLARPVEGAIFAESIPFTETRGYVKNVMSNATYYAALFEGKPQSLKQRLGQVAPRANTPTDLP